MGALEVPRLIDLPRPPPKALGFVRLVRALVIAKGDYLQAATFAAHEWPEIPNIAAALNKAAVDVGTLSDWGQQIAPFQVLASEFVEAARAASILGRLANVRRVPLQVQVARQNASSTVGWVGESLAKPVGELSLDSTTLGPAKVAGIVVISQELARSSSPSAESVIRADMTGSVASFIDQQFLSPANTAVAGVHPGSILNGVTPIISAGSSAANIVTDISALVDAIIAAGGTLTSPVLVMNPKTALRIGLKRDSQGAGAFPAIGFNGGLLMNVPVLTSTSVPLSVSGGSIIALIDQSEVLLADDGEIRIDVSEQASLQMNSTPSAGAQQLVSLWQNNLIGIRAERAINWAPRRAPAAVAAYVDQVAY
jgi:HK97 family phage major capsid protein